MITEKTKKKMSLARKRYWKKRKAALEAFKAKKPFQELKWQGMEWVVDKEVPKDTFVFVPPKNKYFKIKGLTPEITKEKGVIETVMDYLKGIFS